MRICLQPQGERQAAAVVDLVKDEEPLLSTDRKWLVSGLSSAINI
jgi:hypothetical protein